jgi:hypothetical protein
LACGWATSCPGTQARLIQNNFSAPVAGGVFDYSDLDRSRGCQPAMTAGMYIGAKSHEKRKAVANTATTKRLGLGAVFRRLG